MKDTTIAVDLAKNVFEIAISREAGKVSKQLRVSRPKLVSFFAKQSAATVLLEACGSAHFWARTLRRLGHDVVLLPPDLVRPYRRGSKNDRADTKALPPGVYPGSTRIGIPEFAADFGFTHEQVQLQFDCNPESEFNAAIALTVEDGRTTVGQGYVAPPTGAQGYGVPGADEVPARPPDAALNTGVGAEIVVARELEAFGWTVRYRANQRGLGYDLEATREGQTLRVEVKSSVAFANLELQASEWQAAQEFGEHYVLAVVDFYGCEQRRVWYVRNPAANAVPAERAIATYRFARADVEPVMTEVDFL